MGCSELRVILTRRIIVIMLDEYQVENQSLSCFPSIPSGRRELSLMMLWIKQRALFDRSWN